MAKIPNSLLFHFFALLIFLSCYYNSTLLYNYWRGISPVVVDDTYHSGDDLPLRQHQEQQEDQLTTVSQQLNNITTTVYNTSIAYVTYTHLTTLTPFEMLIFPSLETWHPTHTAPYYIVLSQQWKDKWDDLIQTNANFTKYASRMQPIFVDCPEGKFGDSPCCKQDRGLSTLLELVEEQFDFYVYMDDDVYIRHNYLQQLLSMVSPDEVVIFVGGLIRKRLGQSGYLKKQKRIYHCSEDDDMKYPWGQPVIYTKAAISLLRSGFAQEGIRRQCQEYNVTHDVGNAIFHFMYQLSFIYTPVAVFTGAYLGHFYGVHRINRGRIWERSTMNYVHKTYQRPKYQDLSFHNKTRYVSTGYHRTSNYHLYGEPSTWTDKWHTMPIPDCLGESNESVVKRIGS